MIITCEVRLCIVWEPNTNNFYQHTPFKLAKKRGTFEETPCCHKRFKVFQMSYFEAPSSYLERVAELKGKRKNWEKNLLDKVSQELRKDVSFAAFLSLFNIKS